MFSMGGFLLRYIKVYIYIYMNIYYILLTQIQWNDHIANVDSNSAFASIVFHDIVSHASFATQYFQYTILWNVSQQLEAHCLHQTQILLGWLSLTSSSFFSASLYYLPLSVRCLHSANIQLHDGISYMMMRFATFARKHAHRLTQSATYAWTKTACKTFE